MFDRGFFTRWIPQLLMLLLAFSTRAQGIDDRRKLFLDAVWKDFQESSGKLSPRNAFWRAETLFEIGKPAEALKLVNRGLDQMVPGNKENRWIHGGNSGFVAWPGIDCYIRYEKLLDTATRERYRKIYGGAVFYHRLSTSNHKIMAAVTRYLATQAFGADAFHPDPFFQGKEDTGAIFDSKDPTGEKYIRQILNDTVAGGPGEYASRPYGAENLLPLLSIAECAKDESLRARAAIAYEYCILEFAPVWLRGHLATFAPRSYPDVETQQPWGVAALAWAYFGGIEPAHLHEQWALRAATAGYRLPPSIEAIANHRNEAYVHRALIDKWAMYHFIDQSYILFSRSPKTTGGGFMGQSYPCGVMWEEPDTSKGSHLWITNPAADDNQGDAGNRPTGIHTHGVTKYEQELQHRSSLLYVFNIPADFRNPYVLGYVPGGYRASASDEKHLLLHYGTVMVAISASHPIEWDAKAGIKAPAAKPHDGDSEFRIKALQAAVAMEVARPAEFSGSTPAEQLAAFRAAMSNNSIALQPGPNPVATYTTRNGDRLKNAFDGDDLINDRKVDYSHWPALENPWMRQDQLGGPLSITHGSTRRIYDFKNWTVTSP